MLTTFVYGLHSIVRRRSLWNSLKELKKGIIVPWMVIGDFNALLSAQDKVGRLSVTNYKQQDLKKLVHGCNLVDLQSIGCQLTWTNGMVSSKLDQVLVNTQWLWKIFVNMLNFFP